MLVWVTVRSRWDPPSALLSWSAASNGLHEAIAVCGPLKHASHLELVITQDKQGLFGPFSKVFH